MAIHVALTHSTRYHYDRLVTLSPQLVRLRPAPHCRTPILSYSMRVRPAQHFVNWQQDPQSNYLARVTVPDRVREFSVDVDLVAEVSVYNPFDFFLEPQVETFPFEYEAWQLRELQPFLEHTPPSPEVRAYAAAVRPPEGRTIDALVALNRRLQHDVRYLIRLDPGVQTPEETIARGSGSCRDTTWLLVTLLRHYGLAARFVSGYLIQLAPDVKALDGPSGVEQDFTDLHAWCEVYLPGAGWIGFDPTSGLLAGEGHIPLACTPEPGSAAPITGAVDDSTVDFHHEMSVRRIYESPRVTRPYTDEQWAAILALGQTVDEALARDDVRLTMGGEPTFVSVDDRDGAEWNLAALGPSKRMMAADLLWRLRTRFGVQGFAHFGQGKWYPGEQLPRWALGCYWRRDGEPAWRDPALFADERRDYGLGPADAERFIRALATRLGVDDRHAQPGYEDAWYYLWRERRLPVNVDPFDARLDDELERTRLRRVFTRQLDAIVGYALPLGYGEPEGPHDNPVASAGAGRPHDEAGSPCRWVSGPWVLRDERLYLMPGDSAMGLRLPLDSLPWAAESDRPSLEDIDPFRPRGDLPSRAQLHGAEGPRLPQTGPRVAAAAAPGTGEGTPPRRGASASGVVRTALCTETRNGVLYVFLPPVVELEGYLALVAAVEATSAELGLPIVLEGYPPPHDHRLQSFHITPDPGVIEVNVHPADSWDAVVSTTTAVYEEAHLSRLTAEKFMLDGRHTGTGGGNHFVLGGPTAADSPFLRRPDLLRSLVAYWHNHPSLSYLFSGLFIGPTSQAPRVDEARHDSVYELGIAFDRLGGGDAAPPWLVDRALRHLLVDVAGNTHRAEFCIDKLYSPDSSGGRRGLVELRAFEMPPHARMSVAQQLLLRALVSCCWRQPYRTPLVRWGTQLHDRFMLPYFVGLDFDDVLEDLRRQGYAFDPAWFAPHMEFRFPLAGAVAAHGIELTLRQALEPWHVLGEEGAVGGTARYVDSSVERLQVLVSGLTPDRYRVACNGRALPLQPTGRNGEYVAGARYRAWQPASALHPTIPVHAPLTFDIVDTWMQRSVGGCQYHVMHPGGRNYDAFPVNSYEAESRRLARFFKIGHTPGTLKVAPPAVTREFPFTLDLRTTP